MKKKRCTPISPEQSPQTLFHVGERLYAFWMKGQFQGPVIGLMLVVLVSIILVSHPHLRSSDIPFGDGRWYAQQAIELHGLLHSGQWFKFWDLLCTPSTVTVVPSYLLFFLCPSIIATGALYGLINCASWHVILAFSLYGLCRLIGRPVLAIPIFLLIAANNYVLDASYYYYLDMPFAAVCLLALYLLVKAFIQSGSKNYLMAGLTAGLSCFVKPGGSFVFLGLYGITFAAWIILPLLSGERKSFGMIVCEVWKKLWPWLMGFLPVLATAASWNLVQRIVQQWVENQEGNYYAEALTVSGPLRWLYFPLCLSYYYSFAILIIIGLLVIFWSWITPRGVRTITPIRPEVRRALLLVFIMFLVLWGIIFSWGMTYKPIRSLPLMLPLLWVAVFAFTRIREMPSHILCVFAIIYFSVAHIQFAWGLAQKANRSAETYHLTGDWFSRLPSVQPNAEAAISITQTLVASLKQMGVNCGNVAVGTEMLYWNSCSLNWITQLDDLRAGRKPIITFKTAVDNKGRPIRSSFEAVSALVLPVHQSIQYSKEVYRFNVVIAQYAASHWQSSGRAQMNMLKFGDGQPGVALVVFKEPLQMKEWDIFVRSNCVAGYSDFCAASESFGQRLSWRELWHIIRRDRSASRAAK